MKNGFNRLKGVATASAMSLGLIGAGIGTGRAATVTTRVSVGINLIAPTNTSFATSWTRIGNSSIFSLSSSSTTGGVTFSSSSSAFGISDAFTASSGDFYDGGMVLAVGGNLFVNPDNTVDLTGTTLTTDLVTNIVAGVDAQIEYYFDPNRPLVRGLYSLTNTTGTPIMTSALVVGNYGSDGSTTVQATSNGDQVIENTDLWVITDDTGVVSPTSDGGDPTATLSTHGTGASVVPATAITLASGVSDIYGYRYDITIAAGATVRVLVFNEMNNTVDAAVAEAGDFETLEAANTAGLLAGLSQTECSEIVNYDQTGTACGGGSGGGDSGFASIGGFSLPGLAALMGIFGLFRLNRKKH